jgi:hypothetical protein
MNVVTNLKLDSQSSRSSTQLVDGLITIHSENSADNTSLKTDGRSEINSCSSPF